MTTHGKLLQEGAEPTRSIPYGNILERTYVECCMLTWYHLVPSLSKQWAGEVAVPTHSWNWNPQLHNRANGCMRNHPNNVHVCIHLRHLTKLYDALCYDCYVSRYLYQPMLSSAFPVFSRFPCKPCRQGALSGCLLQPRKNATDRNSQQ